MKKVLILTVLFTLASLVIYRNMNKTEASGRIEDSMFEENLYDEESEIEVNGFSHKLIEYKFTRNFYDYGDFYKYDYSGVLGDYSDTSGMMKESDKSWLFFTMAITNTGDEPKVFNIDSIILQGLNEEKSIIGGYIGEVRSYDKGGSEYNQNWLNKTYNAGESMKVRVAALLLDPEVQKASHIAIVPYYDMEMSDINRSEFFVLNKNEK